MLRGEKQKVTNMQNMLFSFFQFHLSPDIKDACGHKK